MLTDFSGVVCEFWSWAVPRPVPTLDFFPAYPRSPPEVRRNILLSLFGAFGPALDDVAL